MQGAVSMQKLNEEWEHLQGNLHSAGLAFFNDVIALQAFVPTFSLEGQL